MTEYDVKVDMVCVFLALPSQSFAILEKPQFQTRRVEQSRKALLLIDNKAIWRLAADFGRAPCSSTDLTYSSPDESRAAPLYRESNSFANLQV